MLSTSPIITYKRVTLFFPLGSSLYRTYATDSKSSIKVVRGPLWEKWPAQLWKADHGSGGIRLAISPLGSFFASSGTSGTIKIWDIASGMVRGAFPGPECDSRAERAQPLIFSADGKTLFSCTSDLKMMVWDVENGNLKAAAPTGHTANVGCLVISPQGDTIATGAADGSVRLWGCEQNCDRGTALKADAGEVVTIAFTPDGLTVICGYKNGTIRRWGVINGHLIGEPISKGNWYSVLLVHLSQDGEIVAVTAGPHTGDIRVWNIRTPQQLDQCQSMLGHRDGITSVSYSPDDQTVVSSSMDRSIRLWDARTGLPKREPFWEPDRRIDAAAFTTDGKMIISASSTAICAWDIGATESEQELTDAHSKDRAVDSIAFTVDGRFSASRASDGSIIVWAMEEGSVVWKAQSAPGYIKLSFSEDGRVLRESRGGDWKDVIREWDVSEVVDVTGTDLRYPNENSEEFVFFVEKMKIGEDGWIRRGEKQSPWLWLPEGYGRKVACYLCNRRLVVREASVPILDLAVLGDEADITPGYIPLPDFHCIIA